jgi:hypothetical protein
MTPASELVEPSISSCVGPAYSTIGVIHSSYPVLGSITRPAAHQFSRAVSTVLLQLHVSDRTSGRDEAAVDLASGRVGIAESGST